MDLAQSNKYTNICHLRDLDNILESRDRNVTVLSTIPYKQHCKTGQCCSDSMDSQPSTGTNEDNSTALLCFMD